MSSNNKKFGKNIINKHEETSKKWQSVTLSDIIKKEKNAIKRGPWGSSLKKEFFVKDGYKVYEQQNAIYNDFEYGKYYIDDKKFNELKDFEVKSGDCIVSCSGTIGKISVVPSNAKKGIINQALLKISLDSQIIDTKFFIFLFQSSLIQNLFRVLSQGVAIKNVVSLKELKQIPIELPPLPEQQKISSILSNVDALINKIQNEIVFTIKLRTGLMQKLLTKGINHKKFKKIEWFFNEKIEIPDEWELKKLKDIAEINPSQIDENYVNIIIKYIDISSIKNFQVKDYTEYIVDERPSRAQRIIHKDDLIVSTVRPYLKGFAKITSNEKNLVCSTGFSVVRVNAYDDIDFVFGYLQSRLFEQNFMREMMGASYPAIRSSTVSNSLIPFPSDKTESKRIGEMLSNIEKMIEKYLIMKSKLEILKKGLMQKLLTGQMRVK